MDNSNNIILELKKRIKRGDLGYALKSFMNSRNIPEQEQSLLIQEAKTILEQERSKLFRYIWISSLLFFPLLNLFIIPLSLYVTFPLGISFITALFTTLSLIQVLFRFKSFEEFNIKFKSTFKVFMFVIPFLISIITLFVLFMNYHNYKLNREIDNYEENAKGTIINKYTISGRRNDLYYVEAKFTDKNGTLHKIEKNVNSTEFMKAEIGKTVEIRYSSRNPELAQIIFESDKQEYQGELRELNLDYLFLLRIINNNQIESYLKQFHYNWKFNELENLWKNEETYETILKSDTNLIVYTTTSQFNYDEYFKIKEYRKFINSNNKTNYENQYFIITIEYSTDAHDYGGKIIIYRKNNETYEN